MARAATRDRETPQGFEIKPMHSTMLGRIGQVFTKPVREFMTTLESRNASVIASSVGAKPNAGAPLVDQTVLGVGSSKAPPPLDGLLQLGPVIILQEILREAEANFFEGLLFPGGRPSLQVDGDIHLTSSGFRRKGYDDRGETTYFYKLKPQDHRALDFDKVTDTLRSAADSVLSNGEIKIGWNNGAFSGLGLKRLVSLPDPSTAKNGPGWPSVGAMQQRLTIQREREASFEVPTAIASLLQQPSLQKIQTLLQEQEPSRLMNLMSPRPHLAVDLGGDMVLTAKGVRRQALSDGRGYLSFDRPSTAVLLKAQGELTAALENLARGFGESGELPSLLRSSQSTD